MTPKGTPYLMSEWEADLNQLLQRLPAEPEFPELSGQVDAVVLKRFPDSGDAERFARRLIVALSFLWNREKDSAVKDYFVQGASGSVVYPPLARALFRIVVAMPDDQLGQPLNSDFVLQVMREEKNKT